MASTGGLKGSDPQRRDSLICFNPICSDKARMAPYPDTGTLFPRSVCRDSGTETLGEQTI